MKTFFRYLASKKYSSVQNLFPPSIPHRVQLRWIICLVLACLISLARAAETNSLSQSDCYSKTSAVLRINYELYESMSDYPGFFITKDVMDLTDTTPSPMSRLCGNVFHETQRMLLQSKRIIPDQRELADRSPPSSHDFTSRYSE